MIEWKGRYERDGGSCNSGGWEVQGRQRLAEETWITFKGQVNSVHPEMGIIG